MELLKGTLDVLILKTLSAEPLHGYGIAKALRAASHEAFQVEEGALYPALRRLEKRGLLEAEWGTTETGREARFYRLTSAGTEALEGETRSWSRYAAAMARVLFGADDTADGKGEVTG
jgi:transcriptional regulator